MIVSDFIRQNKGKYSNISVYDADTMQEVAADRHPYYEVLDTDVIDDNVLSVSATYAH